MPRTTDLTSFRIQRFRGLTDVELADIGLLNVVVGPNDVGKTTVLEALYALASPDGPRVASSLQEMRQMQVANHEHLRLLFDGCSTEPIQLSARFEGPIRACSVSISLVAQQSRRDELATSGVTQVQDTRAGYPSASEPYGSQSTLAGIRYHGIAFDATIEGTHRRDDRTISSSVAMDGETVRHGVPRARRGPVSARMIATHARHDPSLIDEVIRRKKSAKLVKLVQAVNPRIENVANLGNVLHVDVGTQKMLPMNVFGNGLARAVGLAAACILRNEKLLLIDEFENGLHYKTLTGILNMLLTHARVNNSQVVLTAQSIDVLKALRALESWEGNDAFELRDAVVCFKMHRHGDGVIKAYRYDHDQLKHYVDHGMEIRG